MAGSVWAIPPLRFIKYDWLLGSVLIHLASVHTSLCSYLLLVCLLWNQKVRSLPFNLCPVSFVSACPVLPPSCSLMYRILAIKQSPNVISSFIPLCVCVHAHVSVCVHTHVWVCLWRQEDNLSCHSSEVPFIFIWRQCPLLAWSLLTNSRAPSISSTGFTIVLHHKQLFLWVLMIRLRSSWSQGKHIADGAISTSLFLPS